MTSWTGHPALDREASRWLNASAPMRYGMAIGIMIVALAIKYALLLAGLDSFFLVLVPAVVVSALLGGVGPGITVTLLSATVTYFTIDPIGQIGVADRQMAGRLLLYVVDGILLSLIAGALRYSTRNLADSRSEAALEHGRIVLLQDLTARLTSEADAATIAQDVVVRSSELVGCDGAWIVVADDTSVRVLGALERGESGGPREEDAIALARRVIDAGEELWLEVGSDEHDRLAAEHPAGFATSAAVAAVPLLRGDGTPFGVLLLSWRTPHALEPANRELKRAVARITAQALERADLYAAQAARIDDLAERETVRDAFLAVLSHELRTPVTTIFGAAALLSRTNGSGDTSGLLEDIQEESERLRRIVDDLLVLSRSERGAIEVSPEPILIQRAIGTVVSDLQRRYPGFDLRFDAPPYLATALADPTALVQVVYNLVTNAIKYAGEDGPIDVSIMTDDQAAHVSVIDNGPGLGDEPETVFELFHRADHTKRRASGTGIGLYVARELVRAMGGEISGTNRPEGGANFTFTVPLADPQSAPTATPPTAAAAG
ncbi:MAG: ATP-binding protein [Chloroflexota bacterium]